MVYFECDTCISTLKKKQIQTHYQFQCRSANSFSCLTCHQRFDRDSIVAHTSCISEEEKYTKGDAKIQELAKKKNSLINTQNLKDNISELDFSSVNWKGFRKTSKELISMINVRKITIERLVIELASAFARSKHLKLEDIDLDLTKKAMLDKLETCKEVSLDLSKNTVRLKF